MNLSARSTSLLTSDLFTAPIHHALDNHLLIELEMTNGSTQVFLLDTISEFIYIESSFWINDQLQFIRIALEYLRSGRIRATDLSQFTILLGTWHFGHLLGDHAHQLIHHYHNPPNSSQYPLHLSSNLLKISKIPGLLNIDPHRISSSPYHFSGNTIRFFNLCDCLCIFPAKNKSIPLSVAHAYLNSHSFLAQEAMQRNKVFLTSGRQSRISNISELTKVLLENSWTVINPLSCPSAIMLILLSSAGILVSENGSILFNCFLSRSLPYYVLASSRSKELSPRDMAGGGIYNSYHNRTIRYLHYSPSQEMGHPYSDQIHIPPETLTNLQYRP